MTILYLPLLDTLAECIEWAAARGMVAIVERGPDGLYRGIAVPR